MSKDLFMKSKFILSTTIALLLPFLIKAQSQLVIEVTTDNYPTENHWVLYEINGEKVAESGVLLKETTQRDTFELANNNCYYWTIYDKYGDGMSSANGGDYKIYFNGNLAASCLNPNFGDSISVYNLGLTCSANEIKLERIAFNDFISKDKAPVLLEVLNMGNQTITSLEGLYEINGIQSDIQQINSLQIEPAQKILVAFPQDYSFNEPGFYQISATITKVNGEPDSFEANNHDEKEVTVVDGFVKLNVIEDFSSYECSYCQEADAAIEVVRDAYPNTSVVIKYPSWSFADTKYFPEIDDLMDYYHVMGLPQVVLNGEKVNYTSFTPTAYSDSIGIATPVKIELSGDFTGDSIKAEIKITSNIDFSDELRLRGIIIENTSYDVALRYENNDPYYNIAYGLFNGFEGITVNGLSQNETKQYNAALNVVDFPFEEGSLNDMRLVFYLENAANHEVFQTADYQLHYSQKPIEFKSNITNGATDIDTLNLKVQIGLNRHLFDINGLEIQDISKYIKMNKGSENGTIVPFIAQYTNDTIEIIPEFGWEENSTYFIQIMELKTLDGVMTDRVSISFTTRQYSGKDEKQGKYFNIFPNPVNDQLTLQTATQIRMEIYSITGELMMKTKLNPGKQVIDVTHFPEGSYYIKAKSASSNHIVSFIKLSSSK